MRQLLAKSDGESRTDEVPKTDGVRSVKALRKRG